jgi:TonB-dependent SusC/RagA subfamily outer membrane receptor
MWEALQRTVRYADFGESSTGDPARVHRRGFSSISLTEDMPIYIDRIQVRDLTILDALPAADIEQIQVLSGVEATTYYGTNAGDGVILIRTRRGG